MEDILEAIRAEMKVFERGRDRSHFCEGRERVKEEAIGVEVETKVFDAMRRNRGNVEKIIGVFVEDDRLWERVGHSRVFVEFRGEMCCNFH